MVLTRKGGKIMSKLLLNKTRWLINEDRKSEKAFLENLKFPANHISGRTREGVVVTDLTNLTMLGLQQHAAEMGIIIPNRCNKSELIDLINNFRK
jgi:hypothetical protein